MQKEIQVRRKEIQCKERLMISFSASRTTFSLPWMSGTQAAKQNGKVHFLDKSWGKLKLLKYNLAKKIEIKIVGQFYTIYEQKFSNLRPCLSITFPQGFSKSKKFLNLTSGSGGKKTFIQSEQMKNISFFCPGDFTPFMSKSFKIWDHLFPLLFLYGFQKS